MSSILCNTCGREVTDGEELNTCLSCGVIICDEDYEVQESFCKNCLQNGPYQGC